MSNIKVLKHGLRVDGKYIPCWYSDSELIGNYPKGTVTVYASSYCDKLPADLRPENDTDTMTDYFEKDRARIYPNHPLYADIVKRIEEIRESRAKRYAQKYGN